MPFNLTNSNLPAPFSNDGSKFANLFNQLYAQAPPTGPIPAFATPGSGLFQFFQARDKIDRSQYI